GASAALNISSVPFEAPIAGVRVALVENNLCLFPTYEERQKAQLELIVSVSKDSIVMVEGGGKEIPEETLLQAIYFALEAGKPIINAQYELSQRVKREKIPFIAPTDNVELLRYLEEKSKFKVLEALSIKDKIERHKALYEILE
ncbi:MAG: polyribonucleotide nucleotidyltransferase, partial [Caldimicrobium sp.]